MDIEALQEKATPAVNLEHQRDALTNPEKIIPDSPPVDAAPDTTASPEKQEKPRVTLGQAWDLLKSDLRRKRAGFASLPHDQNFFRRYVKINLEFGSIAVMVFRYGQWVHGLKNPLFRLVFGGSYLVLRYFCMALTGISINPSSTIGPGFVIHNFSCIFVWSDQIGENCTVNQGVTIGTIRGSGRPRIGNNVYVGAGSRLLGDIKIGNNVVIAANSLVIMDVPDHATVMGVPARVVARSASSEYLKF